MAGAGFPRWRPLLGGSFPCVQALRTLWTLEPPGSLQVMFRFPPVCTRERAVRGVGCLSLCSFPTDAAFPSGLLAGAVLPQPSACVRDAPSEGARNQQAAWPSATAQGEGGAQGAAVPLARVFHQHRQFLLRSGRLCVFQSIPATCLPATARPRRLLGILTSATLVASLSLSEPGGRSWICLLLLPRLLTKSLQQGQWMRHHCQYPPPGPLLLCDDFRE